MTLAIEPHNHDDWDARAAFRFHWSDATVDESGDYDFDLSHNNKAGEALLHAPYN